MSSHINWKKILMKCKDKIKSDILPHLETSSYSQPNLGKGAGGDPIKLVDMFAEKAIVNTLKNHNITFTLISEESGVKHFEGDTQLFYVTIDPIDGTTNLMHKIPFYCSSIAISKKAMLSDVSIGMVIDLFHDITYFAKKGEGAYCNDQKITPSTSKDLENAIIGLDVNIHKTEDFISRVSYLIKEINHIRHFGANALELCYVADGKTDAFVDMRGKLRTTDIAASYLILMEAGGTLKTMENYILDAKLDPKTNVNFIASGNNIISEKLFNLLKK